MALLLHREPIEDRRGIPDLVASAEVNEWAAEVPENLTAIYRDQVRRQSAPLPL